jgi:hypothetical protein
MLFPVSKEDLWQQFNPKKGGDSYVTRFRLVGVRVCYGYGGPDEEDDIYG